MTAISSVINRNCIAIASDSLITVYIKHSKSYKIIEYTKPKILRMEKYHAAASYWGLAKYGKWDTFEFIKTLLRNSDRNIPLSKLLKFVNKHLHLELERILPGNDLRKGIGIHVTGFENIDNIILPELYLISNFTDPTYSALKRMSVAPQLYGKLLKNYYQNGLTRNEQRIRINKFLQTGNFFTYNNGDPVLFNNFAKSIFNSIKILNDRKILGHVSSEVLRSIAKRPIEIIKRIQVDFCPQDRRLVGGKIHDLLITSNRDYISNSRD